MGHEDKKKKKSSKKSHKRRRHYSDSSSDDERAVRKQRKKAEKVLAQFGYTNESNPFGDSNLSQPFVWGKKYEDKASKKPTEKELKKTQLQRIEEIRKARERRDAREAEKEEMERLKSEELRLRDAEQYEDWQQKEEEFHLSQARVRSNLRIKEKREKPVDQLAKNILLLDKFKKQQEEEEEEGDDDGTREEFRNVRVEKRLPSRIIEVLSMQELEELREDIAAYQELEKTTDGKHKEFWDLMMLLCKDRITRLRRSQRESSSHRNDSAIHGAVNDTITDMLEGKSPSELRVLEQDVKKTIASASSTPGVDVEFWEEVAQQIEVYQARAWLATIHEETLDQLATFMDNREPEEQDRRERERRNDNDNITGRDESREAQEMELSEVRKGLEESEERMGMSEEVAVSTKNVSDWSEKYQPRKPRYFNRVKTGYDWNKYNQTHYDHDNPPPKVVQGYKFNLFYPDLIDKHTAPKFYLEKANSPEFCIIRFSAGPPYQDIAFKIVNREWEYSHKRGFKSVFERGILHLYFNFKRHRYRR